MNKICPICSNQKHKINKTCGNIECIKASRRNTCLEKYGDINPLGKNSSSYQKKNQTVLEKYGVTNVRSSLIVKDTIKNTCLKKYGVTNGGGSQQAIEKIAKTKLERYGNSGYVNPDKNKKTCQERYGVDHHYHIPEIFNKVFKKFHEVISPSGKIIKVQGYERFFILELWKKFEENDIICGMKAVPSFMYLDKNNKKHRYYPDFYVRSINTIYEIKSHYTYEKSREKIELITPIILAAGFKYEVVIIENQ